MANDAYIRERIVAGMVEMLKNKTAPELRQILDAEGVPYPPANLFTDPEYYRTELVKLAAENLRLL